MKAREFEELAFAHWERIPDEYKQGIDGVRVLRRALPHAELPDVYTMGECVTEAYPSEYGGPDTTRSAVVLYWGSFDALSRLDPDFDWEDELWETLTHELRHHLESLASEDALEGVDYAADENFKRFEGEDFDPYFYRRGERVAGGQAASLAGAAPGARAAALDTWRVESDWFFELTWAPDAPPAGRHTLEWLGARHAFTLPEPGADVTFAELGDGFEPGALPGGGRIDGVTLVLVRRASMWRAALDALRGRMPTIAGIELDVTTERS